VRWVDRFGRNYEARDGEFMQKGVIICTVINGLKFDGATQDRWACSGAGFSRGLATSEEFQTANTEDAPRNASLPLEQAR
jgi:putative DNA-invertase from lambdoid prophage Rac